MPCTGPAVYANRCTALHPIFSHLGTLALSRRHQPVPRTGPRTGAVKASARALAPFGDLPMVIPDTLSIWLKEQAWPIAILLSFVAFVFLVLKLSVARRRS